MSRETEATALRAALRGWHDVMCRSRRSDGLPRYSTDDLGAAWRAHRFVVDTHRLAEPVSAIGASLVSEADILLRRRVFRDSVLGASP